MTPAIAGQKGFVITCQADFKRLDEIDKAREDKGYFYFDVYNCQVRLGFMFFKGSGMTSELVTDIDKKIILKNFKEK